MFPRHYETSAVVPATAAHLFEHLDDHNRLSAHMTKSSWKLAGASMQIEFDEQHGRSVGSRIRLVGRILGMLLCVEEVVTEREPPLRKTWETVGVPKLFVIGAYRLGFTLLPTSTGTLVRVFIDYGVPERGLARLLGLILGDFYARWCTLQMVRDVSAHFAPARTSSDTHLGPRSAT